MDEREKTDPKGTPFERGSRIRRNKGAWRPLVDVTEIYCGDRGIDRNGEYNLYDAPIGVGLKVEQATKSEPILEPEMEWERTWESVNPLYMWEDGGQYHMLYGCTYGACYAVSEDAYTWTRPEMGLIEHNGSKKNNIIHEQLQHCHGYFEDPSAPPEERFKTIGGGDDMGWYDPATGERLEGGEAMKRTDAMLHGGDAYEGPEALIWGRTHGYVSPDRLHWTRTEPLADRPVNGAIAARYDSHNEEYYAYIQIMGYAAGGPTKAIGAASIEQETQVRAFGLSRTKDFGQWPAPKLVLEPDAQDDLDVDFYGANYFPYPGRDDLHGMLISLFHRATDHMDGQIAFSHDGLYWTRPERKANLTVGAPGSGEDCMLLHWRTGIVELPDGYWGSAYTACSVLHNVPDKGQTNGKADSIFPAKQPRQIRWARWRPHRFCGVEAETEGRFTIPTLYRHNSQLKFNYRCKPGGWISVELLKQTPYIHPDVDPVDGFTFEESDRLTGDSIDEVVTWNGKSDISNIGGIIAIRVKMFQAKLFAYQV